MGRVRRVCLQTDSGDNREKGVEGEEEREENMIYLFYIGNEHILVDWNLK